MTSVTTAELLRSLEEDCPWCRRAKLEVATIDGVTQFVEFVRCRSCAYRRAGRSFPREPEPFSPRV